MCAEYSDHQKGHIRQATIDFLRQQLHQCQVHTTIHALRGLRLHGLLRVGFVSSTQPYPTFPSTASPFFPTVGCLDTIEEWRQIAFWLSCVRLTSQLNLTRLLVCFQPYSSRLFCYCRVTRNNIEIIVNITPLSFSFTSN